MGWLDIHKDRIGVSDNNSGMRKDYTDDTILYINDVFDQSPSYREIEIDGELHGVRIINDRMYQTANEFEQNMYLLKPFTVINRGAYATYYNEVLQKQETWLIMFYHYHKIYPKAYARCCTKTLNYSNGVSLPCVVQNKISSSAFIEENTTMTLPKDSLAVYVKATEETLNTLEGDRFVIDKLAYEVQSINISMCTEDGIGVVEMAIKKVPLKHDEKEEIGNNDNNNGNGNNSNNPSPDDEWSWG